MSDTFEESLDSSIVNLDTPSPRPSTSGYKRKSQADVVLSKISKKLDEPKQPLPQAQKYAAFGNHVAEKLRNIPTNVAIHCEKVINEALYMAELRNLNITSRVVTDPVQISVVPQESRKQESQSILAQLTQLLPEEQANNLLVQAYQRALADDDNI